MSATGVGLHNASARSEWIKGQLISSQLTVIDFILIDLNDDNWPLTQFSIEIK